MAKIKDPKLTLGARFHLRSIYLRKMESLLAEEFDPTIGGRSLTPLFRTSPARWRCSEISSSSKTSEVDTSTEVTCTITFTFEFVYIDSAEAVDSVQVGDELVAEKVLARIVADISTDYAVASGLCPSDEELERWSQNNTILHAWPYWREYCHATMLRMGLPVTIMPLVQRSDDEIKLQASDNSGVTKNTSRRRSKEQ